MNGSDFVIETGVLLEYRGEAADLIIPEGVTAIADRVFQRAAFIRSLVLPEGLGRIGASAFEGAYMLGEILLPDSVETVGCNAFYGCAMAKRITIGKRLREIGVGAFSACQYLKEITVDEENPYFKTMEGILYTKDARVLLQFPCGEIRHQIRIPDGVEKISPYAFSYAAHILTVELPRSVRYVGREAFRYCGNLASVRMLNPDTETDFFVFEDCRFLQSVRRGEG